MAGLPDEVADPNGSTPPAMTEPIQTGAGACCVLRHSSSWHRSPKLRCRLPHSATGGQEMLMTVPAPDPRASFSPGQEVALVSVRSCILQDVLTVSAVSPLGDVVVTGWQGLFSPEGLEIRPPARKATAVRQHSCEVLSLQGHVLSRLPTPPTRAQARRSLGPRWLIRAATAEDRAILEARDNDLRLMRLIVRRLAQAIRSADPLPREALLEMARLSSGPRTLVSAPAQPVPPLVSSRLASPPDTAKHGSAAALATHRPIRWGTAPF